MLRTPAPLTGALDLMKKILLFAIFALTFIFGASDVWLEDALRHLNQTVLWVSIIVVSVLIFEWVHLDASERHYPKSKWLNLGILAFSIIFVPVYPFSLKTKRPKTKSTCGLRACPARVYGVRLCWVASGLPVLALEGRLH